MLRGDVGSHEHRGLAALRSQWEQRDRRAWAADPERHAVLAAALLRGGAPLLAYDVAREGLRFAPHHVSLRRLQALALARTGAPRQAQHLLEELIAEGHRDAETLGIHARTFKDLARDTTDSSQREALLRQAYATYRAAFESHGDPYPGINAASLSLLLGEAPRARREAQAILERVTKLRAGGTPPDYWSEATIAEARLLCGDAEAARQHYAAAVKLAPRDLSSHATTRRQASRLLATLALPEDAVDTAFPTSNVVAFTGHRLDEPGRPVPRFPALEEKRVGAEIERRLEASGARVGVASAASGGDILFLEAMLARGGTIHVVLPTAPETFERISVLAGADPSWGARFRAVIDAAAEVTVLSREVRTDDATVYDFCNRVTLGLARLQQRQLGARLQGLALWDGVDAMAVGGTGHCVATWRAAGCDVDVIAPAQAVSADGPGDSDARAAGSAQEIRAILFADVVRYGDLDEDEIVAFVEHFLPRVAALCDEASLRPDTRNTWGDAFYFVFPDVARAARFALRLRGESQALDWRGLGLSAPLRLRIALHVGPVLPHRDPITGRESFTGHHVSRAARIEPLAAEGQILTSEPFAALAAYLGLEEQGVRLRYVGRCELPKRFGMERVFLLGEASGI